MAKGKKRGFTFGLKMYLFVVLTVLFVALGVSLVSFYINANQIDDYFKGLTLDSARNFASFVDGDFLEELTKVAESDEFQALREEAETEDDEMMVQKYLQEKGLWTKYSEQREQLHQYLDNMKDIRYLYIVKWGDKNATRDMYVLDDYEEPIYETGYWEDREEAFLGMDGMAEVEPTISTGDWGWLCSGFSPVLNSNGEVVCQVGCDVDMDKVMSQRWTYFFYIIIAVVAIVVVVLILAVLFAKRVVVNPLGRITREMVRFKPMPNITPEEAGLIDLNIKSRDEIYDLYQGVWTMQMDILENLNDLSAMQVDKEKRDAELEVASRLQADMLTKDFSLSPKLSLYATMTPAKEMGGDFYDFFAIDDDHVGIVMADVSGKGIPAAMFMIIAKTLIKTYASAVATPAQVLWDINNKLCKDNPSDLFVTAWYGVLTLSTGELAFSNAGHEYPAILRGGGAYKLLMTNNMPPLATMEDLDYMDQKTTLEPGDRLFLYTDGVPDAKREDGERFGIDRMLAVLNDYRIVSPKELLSAMKDEIAGFVEDYDTFDDITMMSLVWKGKK